MKENVLCCENDVLEGTSSTFNYELLFLVWCP